MFGFHDYIFNQQSGRPEPHSSWQSERFVTWTAWAGSAVSCAGAAFYYQKWGEVDDTALMMLGSAIVFALIAYARTEALERKKLDLRKAITTYEKALANATRHLGL